MEDSQIIALFFARSEQAIDALSQKYGDVCHKIALHILGDQRDAEECVNDAYLGVWNSVPPQSPDPLLTYVCRIVRNLSVKRYHSNTAGKRNSFYDLALDELEGCIPHAAAVEEECSLNELTDAIDRFLGTLDRDSRVLFVRRYWYADSVSELAERFHISSHNAAVRLSRIREKLKKYLRKEGITI